MTQPTTSDPQESEFAAELAEVLKMTRANEAQLAEMAAMGAGIDQAGIIMLRLMTVLDYVLGPLDGTAIHRLQYERRVQEILAQQLKDALAQVRRAKLTQGLGVPLNGNGLLRPGR